MENPGRGLRNRNPRKEQVDNSDTERQPEVATCIPKSVLPFPFPNRLLSNGLGKPTNVDSVGKSRRFCNAPFGLARLARSSLAHLGLLGQMAVLYTHCLQNRCNPKSSPVRSSEYKIKEFFIITLTSPEHQASSSSKTAAKHDEF